MPRRLSPVLVPLLRVVWWCLAAAIVALAVTLSAARLMLPGMSEYKIQIEAMAEGLVERPVEIGALDAAWRGLSPVLRLKQVVIHDARFPDGALRIDEVQVALDVVESLTHREWRTAGLSVIGLSAVLSTDLMHRRNPRRLLEMLGWLLHQRSIALEEVALEWQDPGLFGEPLRLSEISLRLVNEDGRHQLLGEARVARPFGDTLKIAADFSGSIQDPERLRGRLYVKTGGLSLQHAVRWLAMPRLRFSGELDVELWAGFSGASLEWGGGSLTMSQPRAVAAGASERGFSADRLSSAFRWQLDDGGWRVSLREFALQRDERAVWPASEVGVVVQTGERLRIRGHASRIVLEEAQTVLPLLPWIDENALIMVERLQPRGQLHDSEFQLSYAGGVAPAFALRAQFENLQFSSNEGLPGATGLSGSIEGNLQAGFMHLDSDSAVVLAPNVFAGPLPVSRLRGTLHWARYANLFRIETERIEARSGALDALVRMQVDWPYREPVPWLDLQLTMDAVPLQAVSGHLPERVMSPKAVAWLKNAFRAGTASDVQFLLQGRLDRLPFEGNEGRLEASFEFSDVVVDYHPQWGRLHDLQGSALFVGRSMRITAKGARIQQSPVRGAVATIDDLRRPVLEIEGRVGGRVAAMLGYVTSTPLAERFGQLIERVRVAGDASLDLNLEIPLKRGLAPLQVNGRLALSDNVLEPVDLDLAFRNITGEVEFTTRNIIAEGVRAELLEAPVEISIYPWQRNRGQGTVVDIEGPLDLLSLATKRQPALASYASGVADWHAVLLIPRRPPSGEAHMEIELRSDLAGITLDLPSPFRKAGEETRDTIITWAPGQLDREPVVIAFGERVHGALLLKPPAGGFPSAELRFGGAPAQLPPQGQIRLVGQMEYLDGTGWMRVLKSVAGRAPAADAAQPPLRVAMTVSEASLLGYRFRDLGVQSRPDDPWRFLLDGANAAGLVRWEPAQAAQPPRLRLGLDHLVLQPVPENAAASEPGELAEPATLPELDVSIAELRLGERGLGRIRLVGKRLAQGMRFHPLEIEGQALALSGEGSWLKIGDRQSTHLRAEITGGELEELIKLLGDTGSVKGGRLSGSADLNWPGGPTELDLATLEAEVHLVAVDGRLVDVEEGAGKLLNLFSLNSLQRRLSLDFSDLTKGGFSFDRMDGHIVVMDGNAFTNDFTIRGSSAVIEIAGRTGLVAKDYDQLVTVTPQLSASLPIAGAIAGGPAVGAAVFIAEKLVGDEFNRISRT
ncbi:MAG: YhdP family protein, partial [Gammaproteobacteria bacterium]